MERDWHFLGDLVIREVQRVFGFSIQVLHAGHAAGCVADQLVVFGGVERSEMRLLQGDVFSSVTSVFDLRRNTWNTNYRTQGNPVARRNPVHASLGNHFIISSGWDDTRNVCLADTWTLDVQRGLWTELSCEGTPRLEGHKAVMSGFDMFTFGGHNAPGRYPSEAIDIHVLSIGWETKSSASAGVLDLGRRPRPHSLSTCISFRQRIYDLVTVAGSCLRARVACCRCARRS